MLLTGREVEIIAIAVVAIAAALGSRKKWKLRAQVNEQYAIQKDKEIAQLIDRYSKLRDEIHYIRPRHNRMVNEMRELCRERNNSSKVESIINRWTNSFNNPNP